MTIVRGKLNAALDHFAQLGYQSFISIDPAKDTRVLVVTVSFALALVFEEAYREFFKDEPPFPERPARTGTLVYRID
jgi:hypothetical protein